jgi:hypothetical protein
MKQDTIWYMQLWHLLAPPREESARKTKYVLLHKPHLKQGSPIQIFCQFKGTILGIQQQDTDINFEKQNETWKHLSWNSIPIEFYESQWTEQRCLQKWCNDLEKCKDENKQPLNHHIHIVSSNFSPNFKSSRSKNITAAKRAFYKHYYETHSLYNWERMQTYR